MACPFSAPLQDVPLLPNILGADEPSPAHPFAQPQHREADLKHMYTHLPRALAVLQNLITQQKKRGGSGGKKNVFIEFGDVKGETCNMRYLVPSMERFLAQPKFFIIGFFGFRMENSPVLKQIWDLDDKLIAAIPNLPGILGYITILKDDNQYFNYVFLESFDMVDKWRCIRAHESAVVYSPKYYQHVRINHAVLPCNIRNLIENQTSINKLDIIRTKYYEFQNGAMTWTGMRVYKPDEVHLSLPYFKQPRPFTFASFLGCNAFTFYSELVDHIGKVTGLPVRMVDVAALTKDISPRPSDLSSIAKYNIDFAFTCGISYVNYASNLIPMAAPVRAEERYGNKPIYFADIIVRKDSAYQTQEDLKSKVFVINESVSLSGHLMPNHHFLAKGGLQKYFGKVVESSSHANSINFVVDGKADAAGIDSVVLDMEFRQKPERKQQLRIIESTEPCTMPPFVASAWVPSPAQKLVARALTQMHTQQADLLRKNGFVRFAPVQDSDYDSVRLVRKMYHHNNANV